MPEQCVKDKNKKPGMETGFGEIVTFNCESKPNPVAGLSAIVHHPPYSDFRIAYWTALPMLAQHSGQSANHSGYSSAAVTDLHRLPVGWHSYQNIKEHAASF